MTYNTKNTTIVFAVAAMLLVMPIAASNAYGDTVITNVGETCGFSISPAATFGAITRGASSITEQSVVFTPTGGSTGLGVISVVASDWVGDGTRSSGTITVVGVATGEIFTINAVPYTAGATESTPTFTFGGTDIEDAASLARVINAGSDTANVRAYTSGTNVVTIEAETRGSAADSFNLLEGITDAGTLVSASTLTGGGLSITSHIQGETTKFNMVADDGTSSGVAYASKTKSMPVASESTPQEMLGGIDTTKNVNLSLEFSSAFLTAATGTVTFSDTAAVGAQVSVHGIIYTGAASASGTSFAIGASATDSATSLAAVINSNDGSTLTASPSSGVVTITYDTSGTVGNIVELVEVTDAGNDFSVSGATLTGGTEYLENLPYDGALTQTLTFTLACI